MFFYLQIEHFKQFCNIFVMFVVNNLQKKQILSIIITLNTFITLIFLKIYTEKSNKCNL